jgi:hypothetical protein
MYLGHLDQDTELDETVGFLSWCETEHDTPSEEKQNVLTSDEFWQRSEKYLPKK